MLKLRDIASILESKIFSGEEHESRTFHYCRGSDLMSDVLASFAHDSIFLTGLASVQAVRTASISGAGAIVFVRGKQPSEDVVTLARVEGIPIIVTPLTMFVACGRLYSNGMTGVNGGR